jgi:hypothetical protein
MSKVTNLAGQPVLCQILSFLPREIVDVCVKEHNSDHYYKTLTTYKPEFDFKIGLFVLFRQIHTLLLVSWGRRSRLLIQKSGW